MRARHFFISNRRAEMPKGRLVLDDLAVETFEAGRVEIPTAEMVGTHVTGIDSTCPCCDLTFTC
jgi:hypothetical protein